MCMLLLTACSSKEKKEALTSDTTGETTTEKSTRTPNSIVGTWYELRNYDRLNVWCFEENGSYKYIEESKEDNMADHSGSYKVENNVVTMTNNEGAVTGKYRIKYTDYGVKFMYADRAGKPLELYESRQQVLESSEDYYSTPSYYRTIADEEGYVIEDDTLIRYVGYAQEITIPSNVKIVGKHAIQGINLKKITIPGTVEKICSWAIDEEDIEYIYIEEGVEEIEAWAFSNLILKEIHFPESVKKIGEDVINDDYEEIKIADLTSIKIYVKKDSYAHKYFVENGATCLIVED